LGFVRRVAHHRGVVLESRPATDSGRNLDASKREKNYARLALGLNHRTCHCLFGGREISGARAEGFQHNRNVTMENDKPITDKENFPPKESTIEASMVLPSIAYSDGCADGYRKAMLDIMMFALLMILCLKLLPSLSR
jgi:hypothetical protein